MANAEYKKALKRGRRQYQIDLEKGVYPYLQVLEELTSNLEIVSEAYLGVENIPIDQIVGTNSHGRSTAFASNFMPLMDEDTEFAFKWSVLSEAHLSEGIRDSIKCYEFKNRYYVIEGNKRVSVLKHFGAVEINAEVTRLVERFDDSEQSLTYQAYMKFYRLSKVNFLIFSEGASYEKLCHALGLTQKEDWTEEKRKELKAAFWRFRTIYQELGRDNQPIPVSDAFLEYVKVFPLESFLIETDQELSVHIRQQWETYELLSKTSRVAIQMQPPEEVEKRSWIDKIAGAFGAASERKLKVAFVHDKSKEISAWTFAHELGRVHLSEAFPDLVETISVNHIFEEPDKPARVLEELSEEGYDIIFTTTPRLAEETLKAAVKYPTTRFLNCSLNMAYGHIRTYYGRMYEAKFLGGLLAGCLTKTDKVAYIADYPISGMISSINGFARGVQLVNPRAKVYLFWSTEKGIDIEKEIQGCGADLISHQDMVTPYLSARPFGLYMLTNEAATPIKEVAIPRWEWGKFYERIIRSIWSGSFEDVDDTDQIHTINYWWGLASGVIELDLSEDLPEGLSHMISFYKKAIINRSFAPFEGHLTDQAGLARSEEGGYMPTADIVTMDWLLSNIIGEIPNRKDLTRGARSVMKASEEGSEDVEGLTILKTKP